jgi:pimeloyl-ACP methyl ester carboxylesterase
MTTEPAAVHTVTSADGTTIGFERRGQGPPVILVAGALNDRSTAEPLATHLATDFTVYSYDRRGRGDSGDTPPYAVAREIEDLAALIAEAGGAACLYGVSSGAMLAFETAAAGQPVSRLAMFEPPYAVAGAPASVSTDMSSRIAELLAAGRRGDALEYFMSEAVGLPPDTVAGMRGSPMWQGMVALAPTLAYDTAISGDGSLPAQRMASVTVPTLVLDSAESHGWLRQAAEAVAEALPNGRHRSLPGQFHQIPPDMLAPVLAGFFRE